MESKYKLGRLAVKLIIGTTILCYLIIIIASLWVNLLYTVIFIFFGVVSIGLSQLMIAVFDIADYTRQSLEISNPSVAKKIDKNLTDDLDSIVLADKVNIQPQQNKVKQCRFCGTECEENETHCIKCSNEL